MKWIKIPKEETKQYERLDWLRERLKQINQDRMDLIMEIEVLERALAKPYKARAGGTTTGKPLHYPTSHVKQESLPG